MPREGHTASTGEHWRHFGASWCCWGEGSWIVLGTRANAAQSKATLRLLPLLENWSCHSSFLLGSKQHNLSRSQGMPISGECRATLCCGRIIATNCGYFLPAIRKFRCLQSKNPLDSTNTKICGPFKLQYTHLLMKEIASLLIHYYAQVTVQKKPRLTCSSGYRVVTLPSEKICKCRLDKAREYAHHPYFYVFLSIVTTSTIIEKAKQMGWNKHCHQ